MILHIVYLKCSEILRDERPYVNVQLFSLVGHMVANPGPPRTDLVVTMPYTKAILNVTAAVQK